MMVLDSFAPVIKEEKNSFLICCISRDSMMPFWDSVLLVPNIFNVKSRVSSCTKEELKKDLSEIISKPKCVLFYSSYWKNSPFQVLFWMSLQVHLSYPWQESLNCGPHITWICLVSQLRMVFSFLSCFFKRRFFVNTKVHTFTI